MAKVLTVLLLLAIQGCAAYSFQRESAEKCSLTIVSWREVKQGGLIVSKDCRLSSKASSLGANEKLIDLMSDVVKKAP